MKIPSEREIQKILEVVRLWLVQNEWYPGECWEKVVRLQHVTERSITLDLAECVQYCAKVYNVLAKTEPALNGGVRIWSRRLSERDWYSHGQFGTDVEYSLATQEVVESFRLRYVLNKE